MAIENINDNRIDIPADMEASLATHDVGGDFDMILYRDQAICTFENGRLEAGLYVGPFGIIDANAGDIETVADLAEARAYIDALAIAKKWVARIGGGFHPDNRAASYSPAMPAAEAAEYDADMERLFAAPADPYAIAVKAIEAAAR